MTDECYRRFMEIKVHILDPGVFLGLDHRDVRSYLVGRGWRVADQIPDLAEVMTLRDCSGEPWEVLVPLRATVGDYALRMAEIVRTLAKLEDRSELLVLADMELAKGIARQ